MILTISSQWLACCNMPGAYDALQSVLQDWPTSKMHLKPFDKKGVYFELLRTQKQSVCDQEAVFKTHPLAFCRAKQLEGGASCVGHHLLLLTRQSLAPRATPRSFLARSNIASPELFNQSHLSCAHTCGCGSSQFACVANFAHPCAHHPPTLFACLPPRRCVC